MPSPSKKSSSRKPKRTGVKRRGPTKTKRTIAVKLDQALWAKSKQRAVKRLGGKWSARAAQLAVHYYKAAGGRYSGKKNVRSNALAEWTREKWRTKSGRKSSETGERYLPEKIIQRLPASVYRQSTRAKRTATAKGKQWSKQPKRARELVKRWRKKLHYD